MHRLQYRIECHSAYSYSPATKNPCSRCHIDDRRQRSRTAYEETAKGNRPPSLQPAWSKTADSVQPMRSPKRNDQGREHTPDPIESAPVEIEILERLIAAREEPSGKQAGNTHKVRCFHRHKHVSSCHRIEQRQSTLTPPAVSPGSPGGLMIRPLSDSWRI